MGSHWQTILLIMSLIVLNGLLAGSEIALISLREGQLRQLEHHPNKAARTVLRLAQAPTRLLATIQLGITLCGFLASATAAVSLAEPLMGLLGFLGPGAETVAVGAVTAGLTFLTLVFGELVPKRLAMQDARRWALLAARPLGALASISRPAVWALGVTTDLVVRALGGRADANREPLTDEELRDLVATHRGLNAEQRTIITGALDLGERRLRDIVVPRRAVLTLPADTPMPQARGVLAASGHCRAAVSATGHLDDVCGVVHLRDLLADAGTIGTVVRRPLLLPDTLLASDALRRFRAERESFALVVDERGAISGIVTRQDVLDEIVGEIDTPPVVAADGGLRLPGTFAVHDLPDLGINLTDRPPGDYVTVAGLVLAVLGRIPDHPGDRVRVGTWTIEVTGVDHHAVTTVRISPPPARPAAADAW
jgi:putative hemolysin